MAVEIKLLRRDDAAVLTNVASGVFDDPIIPLVTEKFLIDSRHHIAVAVDDGVVVGFVSAVHYAHPDKPRAELWINEIGVAPTHQGRGLGKELMRSMLATGRRLGCTEAWVLTDRSNESAMKLYSSSGGADTDQVMFTFRLDS